MQKIENQQRNISWQLQKLAVRLIEPQKTHSSGKCNDGLINGANANTITPVDNIDNIEIVAYNVANAATNAENVDTESTNTDNINNEEIENDKSEDIVMSDDNMDNAAMSNKNNHDATSGDDNTENVTAGETSTDDVPSPLLYGRKTTDPSKVETLGKHRPIRVKP